MKKYVFLFVFALLLASSAGTDISEADVQATVDAILSDIPEPVIPEPEVVVITATPAPYTPMPEATVEAFAATVQAFNDEASDTGEPALLEEAAPTSVYGECHLDVQYFEEMMWNGSVADQNKKNANFPEFDGHMAWAKVPTETGYDRVPMVLTQYCGWFVQGYLYRTPTIGFTAMLDDDGLKTIACTWWELKASGLKTTPCFLEVKNPFKTDGIYKVHGTIAPEHGSFRDGLCISADKHDMVGDVACKNPPGNSELNLVPYPHSLEIPALDN